MTNIRFASLGDIEYIASHLRGQDRIEAEALAGPGNVETAVKTSALLSRAFVFEDNGTPVALFGCRQAATHGVPWMVATDAAVKYQKELMAYGKGFTQVWPCRDRVLRNKVYARNTTAIRWLRRLGYTVHTDKPMNSIHPGYAPFYEFSQCVSTQPASQ